MQKSEVVMMPPPPPPPLPNFKSNKPKSEMKNICCQDEIFKHIEYIFQDCSIPILYSCKPIVSILQNGPCCGMVALAMASQFFTSDSLSSDQVLNTAKELDFSRNGEMFSSLNLAKLASTLLNCQTRVVSNIDCNRHDILRHILHGLPVLFPYDADKNHTPCLNKGKNAHWAIICGICFPAPKSFEFLNKKYISFNDVSVFKNMTPDDKCIDAFIQTVSNFFIFAYQGKSKHLACWDFDELIKSNLNLINITNKYSSYDMVLPSDSDPLSELRDSVVLLGSF